MTTIYNTSYHLKGIEVVDGKINLNDGLIEGVSCLCIGDWSLEIGQEGDLIIKNDDIIQAMISNDNLSYISDLRYERVFMIEPININESKGLLVSNTGQFYNYDLSQNPTENYSQPMIKLSCKDNDPCVMGVILDCEKYSREYTQGAFKTVCSQDDEVNRVFVNNKGSGVVWVCDKNGNFHNGDYITTSSIPGYGMKQSDNINRNYTFAKITHKCNFNPKNIVLQKPVDFDEDGPIYEPIYNTEGDTITDLEYQIKYVTKDGVKTNRKAYEKDIQRLLSVGIPSEEIMKSEFRKIFKCSLVGYYI